MRQDKDQRVGALDRLGQVGFGDNVVAERDPGQVLDILVLLVDDFRQLAAFKLRVGVYCSSARLAVGTGVSESTVDSEKRRTSSSKHHILTSVSKRSLLVLTFFPTKCAMADPQLPLPASEFRGVSLLLSTTDESQ